MIIILARHGNTFKPGDRIYRVGRGNDLALTAEGISQAEAFAAALTSKKITPSAIYCSPLQRTKQFAETIINKMDLDITFEIDECLNELDYGDWAGLTDPEIIAKFGTELKAWNEQSIWPKNSAWPENEAVITDNIKSFAQELSKKHDFTDIVIIVSSNGILRYFLKLIENSFENQLKQGGLSVKTGNACKLVFDQGKFKLEAWNIKPVEL